MGKVDVNTKQSKRNICDYNFVSMAMENFEHCSYTNRPLRTYPKNFISGFLAHQRNRGPRILMEIKRLINSEQIYWNFNEQTLYHMLTVDIV